MRCLSFRFSQSFSAGGFYCHLTICLQKLRRFSATIDVLVLPVFYPIWENPIGKVLSNQFKVSLNYDRLSKIILRLTSVTSYLLLGIGKKKSIFQVLTSAINEKINLGNAKWRIFDICQCFFEDISSAYQQATKRVHFCVYLLKSWLSPFSLWSS